MKMNTFKVLNKIARPCKCNYSPHYQRNKNDIKHDNKGNNVKTMTDTSQKKLNSAQCRLLTKGLKFVPTKRNVDIGKLIADLKLWERRMRPQIFFTYKMSHLTKESQEIPKTNDIPIYGV